MIEKIYTYSRDIAKSNKISYSIVKCCVLWISIIFFSIILAIPLIVNETIMSEDAGVLLVILLMLAEFGLYTIQVCKIKNPRMKAFVLHKDGKIMMVTAGNNAGAYVAGGMVAGKAIKTNTNSEVLGSAVELAGSIETIAAVEKIAQSMENPQYVQKLYTTFKDNPQVRISEIYKIHSIEEKKKYYKIQYDAIVHLNGRKYGQNKTKKGKSYKLYKAYTDYKELIELLKQK